MPDYLPSSLQSNHFRYNDLMEDRLQKILSRAGLGSRRACEELILLGRVTVNGQRAELGQKADPTADKIAVDGKLLAVEEPLMYIAVYKPRGIISAASSPEGRTTVRELVPVQGHLYPVGRLDADSEGLILLTNDGELANKLTHPRYGHEKEYRVLLARQPDEEQLNALRKGVVLDDGKKTLPANVWVERPFGKGAWARFILKEGRKRQLREMGEKLGLPVVRIIRVRIGELRLGNLRPREWRHLTEQEVKDLKAGPTPVRGSREREGKPPEKRLRPRGPDRLSKSEREMGSGDERTTRRRAPSRRSVAPFDREKAPSKSGGKSAPFHRHRGPDERAGDRKPGNRRAGPAAARKPSKKKE
jgi:23S rRNA pseudouridine2605 synthase